MGIRLRGPQQHSGRLHAAAARQGRNLRRAQADSHRSRRRLLSACRGGIMADLSIRSRLTIWYSLVLLTALTMFGLGIWLAARHSLMGAVDKSLVERAKGVETVLSNELDPAHPQQLQEEL